MARHVQSHSASGERSAENHDYRRARGTAMGLGRPALWAMGCAAQIELEKVTWPEWKSQMHRGRKRRDVRGSGGRTRARCDGEGWRGVPRHGSLHQARLGDAGEAASALDPQIYVVLLTEPFSAELPGLTVYRSREKSGDVESWRCTQSCSSWRSSFFSFS